MTFETDRAALQTATDAVLAQAEENLRVLTQTADASFGSQPFNVDTLVSNDYSSDYLDRIEFPTPDIPVPPEFENYTTPLVVPEAFRGPPDAVEPEYSAPVVEITVTAFDTPAPVPEYMTRPDTDLPNTPGDAPQFELPDIPVAPPVDLPAVPDLETLTFPDAPATPAVNIPTAPIVSLPEVPTFESLNLPTAPVVDMPTFTAIEPTDDLVTPTTQFEFYEAAYESTLLDPLKAKLLADLTDGGYGIETADEVALFNRERDREVELALTRIEDAGRGMAARGFPLPPGELSIHMDRAWQDMQDKVSGVSRDITLQRNKLFVENRQFTIEQTKGVEQILIGFHNSIQERALNVARATVEMSVLLYNALIERYKSRWQGYQAQAAVFAEKIRAQLALAEIYRTEVEAKSVQVQMNRAEVEIYRAQIEGEKLPVDLYRVQMDAAKVGVDIEQAKVSRYRAEVEATGVKAQIQQRLIDTYLAQLKGITISVDIFRTEMEAANIRAGIERLRGEAFRTQVETYSAQVQAKVAEFGLYRAQIDGEKAKVEVFDSQVRAYSAQVSAQKAKADVQIANLQSETERARTKLEVYRGDLMEYEADLRSQVDIEKLKVDVHRADVEGYMARVRHYISANEQLVASAKEVGNVNAEVYKQVIAAARIKLEAAVKGLEYRIGVAQYGSEKYFAQLTALSNSANTLAVQTETL